LLLEIFHAHRHMVSLMRQVKDTSQKAAAASPGSDKQMDLFG
jgi:hypothetical protein